MDTDQDWWMKGPGEAQNTSIWALHENTSHAWTLYIYKEVSFPGEETQALHPPGEETQALHGNIYIQNEKTTKLKLQHLGWEGLISLLFLRILIYIYISPKSIVVTECHSTWRSHWYVSKRTTVYNHWTLSKKISKMHAHLLSPQCRWASCSFLQFSILPQAYIETTMKRTRSAITILVTLGKCIHQMHPPLCTWCPTLRE